MQDMTRSKSLGAIALLLAAIAALTSSAVPYLATARTASLDGSVLHYDGSPAVGATVRVKATTLATVTDARGRFHLPGGLGRVTASEPGYFVAGSPATVRPLTLRLFPMPVGDHAGYEWVDPSPGGPKNCGTCHEEIYREWQSSAHARSATGAHFRDLYNGTDAAGHPGVSWGLRTEFPDGVGVCASCHAPAIREADPVRFDLARVSGVAARGVHCDYCHKVSATGDGPPGLTHGSFDLRLARPAGGQVFFGPLDDVDRGEDVYSPLYRDSRYCASCHEGTVFGVHVYSTYSEWLASPARREGKQCQDCHMAPTGEMTNIAPGHGGVKRDPKTLASHRFFAGGQAEMLRRAVRMTAAFRRSGDGVRAEVRVCAEGVGHRVPTGFLDRHLLLVIEGFDAADRPLALVKGPTLGAPAGRTLAGQPGRLFGRLHADFDGHSPAPFWRGGTDPVDTRLLPGVAEVSEYAFPAGLSRVRVRLLYRRFWEEVVTAKGWGDRDVVVVDELIAVSAKSP
jgi:hypothetical protein